MLRWYTTEELKTHIFRELEPIREYVDLRDLYFDDQTHGEEGTYVFFSSSKDWHSRLDYAGYHFVHSERGNEELHKITDKLFEITFWTIEERVHRYAIEEACKHYSSGKEFFAYMDKITLALLAKVGPNYRKAGEIMIDELNKTRFEEKD